MIYIIYHILYPLYRISYIVCYILYITLCITFLRTGRKSKDETPQGKNQLNFSPMRKQEELKFFSLIFPLNEKF